ncbi:MAG: hypothetical protein C0498_12125 [Anaerolinea sp.]|nr:hypothetical protein [Anaerolinea sp.]
MGRRPEPETIDVDLSREPIRPDHGYRVGARISVGDVGRTRLAGAIAIGIVLIGIAFAAVGSLLPQVPELPVAPVPSRSVATPLPAIALLRPPAPTRLLPVFAGGLRWLDPSNGTTSGDIYTAPRGGLLVDAEGRALCVCLEIPWSEDRLIARVTLRRYSSGGEEIARVALYELETTERGAYGEPIQVEPAIAPDGRYLWIARAVRDARAWKIGLDRVDLASLEVDSSIELDPIPVPSPNDDTVLVSPNRGWITHRRSTVRMSLRVSPDGSRLSVLLSLTSDPRLGMLLPAYQLERLVVASDLAAGTLPEVAVPVYDATLDPCDSELSGWATNRLFITICSRPEGDGVQPFVRIEDPGDLTRDVTVGPPVGTNDSEWLLDTSRGALYRWSSLAHVFTRLQVATRSMATLAIDRLQVGTGDLAPWPAAAGGESPWTTLADADLLRPARMVGSRDGTLIYALGFRSVADEMRDDRIASTGIWVLDAERTVPIARWAPAALYDQIGFMPGWERLVTVALPGIDADGDPAGWSTSMWLQDARSGDIVEILGNVTQTRGFDPILLAPNAPRGIAGF